MKENVLRIMALLERNKIRFLLLRPIDFQLGFNDIDLVVHRKDFLRMLFLLENAHLKPRLKRTNSNQSVRVFVDGIILDVQFYICYLPYKSLVLKHPPPYAAIQLEQDRFMVPAVRDEVLFTYWTYRLLLDKKKFRGSEKLEEYRGRFKRSGQPLINDSFFEKWTVIMFGHKNLKLVKKIITETLSGTSDQERTKNSKLLLSCLIERRPLLLFKIYFDKIRFRILRRLGWYDGFVMWKGKKL